MRSCSAGWMTQLNDPLALNQRAGLPDALRVLIDAYPRATWEQHPNFGEMVRFWMQRHAMFRQLTFVLRADAQKYAGQGIEFKDYAQRLSYYGGTLINELHGHHNIEDHHYFPRLIKLDARLERGFELLETDHRAMDGLLHGMAQAANSVLQGGAVGVFLEKLSGFETLLDRHLCDEEDIVVPVVLDTGFRG